MKFKGLFIALAAAVASLLVACQKEKPVFGISVDKDVIEFTQSGGQAQVQVTTAQAWNVSIPADAQAWLTAGTSWMLSPQKLFLIQTII